MPSDRVTWIVYVPTSASALEVKVKVDPENVTKLGKVPGVTVIVAPSGSEKAGSE